MRHLVRFVVRRILLFFFNVLAPPTHYTNIQQLRYTLLRILGLKIGMKVQLSESLYFYNGANIVINNGVRLGSFCKIWDFCEVILGEDLLASHNLTIISATHDLYSLANKSGPVIIGANCWIGANVTIVGPVRIGNNVIIGAGAFVKNDLPESSICGGVPARVIRYR